MRDDIVEFGLVTKGAIEGDEDGAFIISQAQNFEISEIIRNASTNWMAIYRYKPQLNFTGVDSIKIETHQESDGASPPTKTEIVKIKFIIAD